LQIEFETFEDDDESVGEEADGDSFVGADSFVAVLTEVAVVTFESFTFYDARETFLKVVFACDDDAQGVEVFEPFASVRTVERHDFVHEVSTKDLMPKLGPRCLRELFLQMSVEQLKELVSVLLLVDRERTFIVVGQHLTQLRGVDRWSHLVLHKSEHELPII
jgi:hypothetical protein